MRHITYGSRKSTLLLGLAAFAGLLQESSFAASSTIDFATEIQPIFRASCYTCHQGDKAAAGLHLDSKAALAGGVSGKAIVPGRSTESLIVTRLLATDTRVRMPFGALALAPEKIALIRAWIEQGAK